MGTYRRFDRASKKSSTTATTGQRVVISPPEDIIATEGIKNDDTSVTHYSIVVLRDDQIPLIADAVVAALAKK